MPYYKLPACTFSAWSEYKDAMTDADIQQGVVYVIDYIDNDSWIHYQGWVARNNDNEIINHGVDVVNSKDDHYIGMIMSKLPELVE